MAILMANEPTENRDIVIRLKDGHLKRISELHTGYDPLQYSVLFPYAYGTDGYHIYMQGRNGRKVTQQQYYCFHMMVRDGNYLLQGARLFQQYLVDAYSKIETEPLQFLRREQQTLRAKATRACETACWQQMEILAKSASGWCSQLHTQVGRGTCMRNSTMPWPTSDAWGGLTYLSQ